ncbi:MAG: permease [Roseiflexaceae bacterium]
MGQQRHLHPADLLGLGRLAADATLGLTDLVEALHAAVATLPGMPAQSRTSGITGLVYGSIRGITRLVGGGLGALHQHSAPLLAAQPATPEREAVLAALNGVIGDYLAATGNPLAIRMQLRQQGQPLALAPEGLAAIPQPSGRVVLLAHGLCMNDLHWRWQGHDHGSQLAADLGYTPVYLHYNTGLHLSANGRALAGLIETLLDNWPTPVQELAIVAHSMGGLVCRSACHYAAAAGLRWPTRLRSLVCLGTPHHGAPLERLGCWVHGALETSPYTAAFARLGTIRSAGITDLRYGSLLDEDRAGGDRFAHSADRRHPVPLPAGVACYAIAATTATNPGDLRDQLLGDGLVPLDSALGHHTNPARALAFSGRWVGRGMGHLDLLHRPDVYAQIRDWLAR